MNIALGTLGGFFSSQFDIGEKKSYMPMKQYAWPDITTPLQSAWSMVLSAVTVVSDLVIYFIVKAFYCVIQRSEIRILSSHKILTSIPNRF